MIPCPISGHESVFKPAIHLVRESSGPQEEGSRNSSMCLGMNSPSPSPEGPMVTYSGSFTLGKGKYPNIFKDCWTQSQSCHWYLETWSIIVGPLLQWRLWELGDKWGPGSSLAHSVFTGSFPVIISPVPECAIGIEILGNRYNTTPASWPVVEEIWLWKGQM